MSFFIPLDPHRRWALNTFPILNMNWGRLRVFSLASLGQMRLFVAYFCLCSSAFFFFIHSFWTLLISFQTPLSHIETRFCDSSHHNRRGADPRWHHHGGNVPVRLPYFWFFGRPSYGYHTSSNAMPHLWCVLWRRRSHYERWLSWSLRSHQSYTPCVSHRFPQYHP